MDDAALAFGGAQDAPGQGQSLSVVLQGELIHMARTEKVIQIFVANGFLPL